jgi:hypothetical protein
MFSRSHLLLVGLLFSFACRMNGPVIGQTAGSQTPTREPVLAPEVTLAVMTKRDPDALIARDGSSCRVAPDVYANTSLGAMFRCRWLRN